ncbi:hypothetical protein SAMN05443575_3057 [Jatrophihabitans endophyticus]|uniref:Uncharacterized protein n=1 Tax=Jatrophihabitans endophyticus TaxID=1206085 RepID=A0A1M5PEC0_9ACTN|nr:ankyrin repeat domain-containing protein [Jatrophihabitans endophyticus]SHH00058.1 hypothetical protein SAMN05443575_3057 [Jatrophihabitans endophyticus]
MTELTDDELAFLAGMFDLAREGRTAELRAAIDAGVPANLTNESGDTLLVLAAYHDHPATVQALLAAGADPERVNDRGQTALAAATFRRSGAGVSALLAAGADPRTGPRSALDVARFFGLDDMLALLEPADAGPRGVAGADPTPAGS